MPAKPTVFISYRRSDSSAIAERIYDRLENAFGKENVFKDSYNITPGEDFRTAIRREIGRHSVLLVIIGPSWLNASQGNPPKRRLDDPNDWVLFEVETGLNRRARMQVIPVLVQGANMPPENELPLDIQDLAYRNAVKIGDDPQFHRDIDALIKFLVDIHTPAISDSGYINPPKTDSSQTSTSEFLPLQTPSASRIYINQTLLRTFGGIVVVLLTLLFAFLALFPEQTRTEWLRSLNLLPSFAITPSPLVSNTTIPSATPAPLINTNIPTISPISTTLTIDVASSTAHNLLTATDTPSEPPTQIPIPTSTFASTVEPPTPASPPNTGTIQNLNGNDFALVPAGNFLSANVSEFWIMVFEVSNAQFAAYLNSRGNQSTEGQDLLNARGSGARIARSGGQWNVEPGYENHPVIRVTWYGARDYCASIGGRLPTALEWQKAAVWNPSTGQTTIYPWGNNSPTPELANYGRALSSNTAPVDAYPEGRSYIGAYNMSGNASEWIADVQGTNRFWRGGSWENDAAGIRGDTGGTGADTFTTASSGFRCAYDNN